MAFRSKRPYLIRALNDWIVDSDLTPYLMVDATGDSVAVPEEFVSDGRIVLNISPSAVRDLLLADEAISFSARFGGRPCSVYVPIEHILAIYAQETNEGMMFDPESQTAAESVPPSPTAVAPGSAESPADGDSSSTSEDSDPAAKPGGHLKLVD
jgi:stringent starvation protein B